MSTQQTPPPTQVLVPEKKPLEVHVSIPERAVTEDEYLQAMRRQGAVEIHQKYLEDMESVGIYARKASVNTQRGKALMNQHRLERCISRMAEIVATTPIKKNSRDKTTGAITISQLTDVARATGFLAGKFTESQHFMVELEGVLRPASKPTDPDQIQNSFGPGAKVQPGTTQIVTEEVHIHNGETTQQKS